MDFRSCEPKRVAPDKVTLNKRELTLKVGGSETLQATVTPADTSDKIVTFESSDKTVATVTAKQGKVTAIKVGTATITAKTVNDKKVTCVVTVTDTD